MSNKTEYLNAHFGIKLRPSVLEKFKQVAEKEQRTPSDLARIILEAYLTQIEEIEL